MSNRQIDIEEMMEGVAPVEELTYMHIEERYRNVQMILTSIGYLLLAAAALFLLLLDTWIWCAIALCVIALALGVNMIILLKAWEYKGYALRERDITYRSGAVFPRTTTVPYDRLQQVTVKQNPVSKMFGLHAVEIVNGAQGMASLTIHGLTEENANRIKDIVIEKLKHDDE